MNACRSEFSDRKKGATQTFDERQVSNDDCKKSRSVEKQLSAYSPFVTCTPKDTNRRCRVSRCTSDRMKKLGSIGFHRFLERSGVWQTIPRALVAPPRSAIVCFASKDRPRSIHRSFKLCYLTPKQCGRYLLQPRLPHHPNFSPPLVAQDRPSTVG